MLRSRLAAVLFGTVIDADSPLLSWWMETCVTPTLYSVDLSECEHLATLAPEQVTETFGAALRRLRKQRRLRRSDFQPLTEKTIARLEQGLIARPRGQTMMVISRRLNLSPDEIASF